MVVGLTEIPHWLWSDRWLGADLEVSKGCCPSGSLCDNEEHLPRRVSGDWSLPATSSMSLEVLGALPAHVHVMEETF